MLTSIDQLITEIQIQRNAKFAKESPRSRAKWTAHEEALFEQLVARFGSDYELLRSFIPRKTDKQIRKKYRLLLAHRCRKIEKMEQEIGRARRKAYFDRQILEETDATCRDSSSRSRSPSPSCDLSPQSLP